MKTVFSSHSQLAHVWAQQRQSYGRAGNMFFEDNAIYSWGKHWVIAFFVDPSCSKFMRWIGGNVIINSESCSVSTHRHTGIVIEALRGSKHHAVYFDSEVLVSRLYNANGNDDTLVEQYALYCFDEYRRHAKDYQGLLITYKDSYKRAPNIFFKTTQKMVDFADEYNRLLKFIADENIQLSSGREFVPIDDVTMTRICAIHNEITEYKDNRAAKKEAHKLEQERIREEQRLAKLKELEPYREAALKIWREGNERSSDVGSVFKEAINAFIYSSPVTRLRYRNDTIYTSRGAEVPLEHAKNLIKSIQRVTVSYLKQYADGHGAVIDVKHPIRVGHFSLNQIDLGAENIKIGCHTLTFAEINNFVDYASEHLDIGVDASYKLP